MIGKCIEDLVDVKISFGWDLLFVCFCFEDVSKL